MKRVLNWFRSLFETSIEATNVDSSSSVTIIVNGKTMVDIKPKKPAEEKTESCPECGSPLRSPLGGGVQCTKCDYWFCY